MAGAQGATIDRRRRLGALLAAVLLGGGPVMAAETPLKLAERGVPVVDLAINGKGPFAMVLDTGAGLTTVTTALKDELGLMKVGRMAQPVQLAGGAQTVDIYTLGFVVLAGEPAPAPITVILDAPLRRVREARGILGMNVLSRFAVEIDQPGRRLSLHPAGTAPARGADWSLAPMARRADFFIVVGAEIDGVPAQAMIDTGANETILNAALAEALGITAGAPGAGPAGPGIGGVPSLTGRVAVLSVAGASWRDLDVQAADLPLFAALGLDEGPALVLGNDALKLVRLHIDYAGDRLYLTRPPAAPVVGARR